MAGLASSESAPAASSAEPLPADNEPVEQEPEAMEIETTKQPNWKHLIASAESETELESLLARKRAAAPRLAPTACLFCPATSDSPEENLEHMSKSHSFFVPFLENVVDVPGLLERLGEIITLENFCLWCGDSGKRMYDMDSVRRHMLDLGHCRIGEVVEEACEEFWSFDSEDGQLIAFEPTVEEGHLQLGNSRTAIPRSLARFYKQNLLPSQVHAKVTQSYKLLGYKDSPLEERKKRHAQRLETRAKLGWEKKMGERGNGLMKHFRIQIPF